MKKLVIRYGIIAGTFVALLMVITLPLAKNPDTFGLSEILGYTAIILSLSTIFIAIKTFRDKYNNGIVTFGKAFLIGLYITLIAGFIWALTFQVYNAATGGDFVDVYQSNEIKKINATQLDSAKKSLQIRELNKNIEMYSNPIVMFFTSMFFEYVPFGVLASLIAAAILKKK